MRTKNSGFKTSTVGVSHTHGGSKKRKFRPNWKAIVLTGLVVGVLTALVVWFLRWDRGNTLSHVIQRTGPLGIGIAILLMAVLSLLPVPSEFLMIIVMKIYGPWWGILYSWIGSMTSALTTFWLARHIGKRILRAFISDRSIKKVSHWIEDRGATGLLMVRIVPVPFLVVNYTAGISKGVTWWNYGWTTAVGGIPYYVGSALVFMGASHKYMTWVLVGGLAVVGIWVGGYLYNRHMDRDKRKSTAEA